MVDKAYAAAHGIDCSPFENHNITVETLEAVLKQQGTILQQADILLVRTGLADKLTGKTGDEHAKSLGSICSIGVEGSVDTAWWFWNHHFAAVAGDTTAFENLSLAEDRGVGAGGITHLRGSHMHSKSSFSYHSSSAFPPFLFCCGMKGCGEANSGSLHPSAPPILHLPLRPPHRRVLGTEGPR